MTRAFLRALDTESIPWRLIDRRFSSTVSEVGRFSPRKVGRGFGLAFRLCGAIASRRPGVAVLFATTRSFSFLADCMLSEVLRALRVPVILYLHTVGFFEISQRGIFWRRAVRRLLGSAKAVVILDESLASDVEELIDGQVFVIGNTLPELPPAERLEIPMHSRDIVLFLSNLIPGKGHEDFLAVAAACLGAGLKAKFVLAGAASPSVAEEVNASIARSGWASNISYEGAVGGQDKWALLTRARALVFPSAFEAFPLVLLEAAACGVPIAAYRTGALAPRLAASGAAVVVDPGDRESLAGATRDILQSPELAERLGTNARAFFTECLSPSTYAASWVRLLRRFGVQSISTQDQV